MPNNAFRLFIAIFILIICGVLYAGFIKQNHKRTSVTSTSVELPIAPVSDNKNPEKETSLPVKAALIIDVSGSMNPYQEVPVNGAPFLNYLITNIVNIWVPHLQVKRSYDPNPIRYEITDLFCLGTGIKKTGKSNSFDEISNKTNSDFRKYTALDQGMQLATDLFIKPDEPFSSVIMLTDMDIAIGVSKDCPQGKPPYCVAERLRALYSSENKPGWWLIGFDLPYKGGKRPLFISLWSYDLEQARSSVRQIAKEVSAAAHDKLSENDIHVLEIYPANSWKPVNGDAWHPSGKVSYDSDSSLKYIKSEPSFVVSAKFKDIDLNWSINRYLEDNSFFETVYDQILEPKLDPSTTLKGTTIKTLSTGNDSIHFQTSAKGGSIQGSYNNPDRLGVIITATPKYNPDKLSWLTSWDQQIPYLKNFIDGAAQIADVRAESITSAPIQINFRKR